MSHFKVIISPVAFLLVPCFLPFHAFYRSMLSTVPCFLPFHAFYRSMLSTVPCFLPFHAFYRSMLSTVPCFLPFHAFYRSMLSTVPCFLPFHAFYRSMLSTVPCFLLFHSFFRSIFLTPPPHPPHTDTDRPRFLLGSFNLPLSVLIFLQILFTARNRVFIYSTVCIILAFFFFPSFAIYLDITYCLIQYLRTFSRTFWATETSDV